MLFVGIGFLWLFVLSFYLFKLNRHYAYLISEVDQKTLPAVLESILKDLGLAKKDIALLLKRCDNIEKESKEHLQKIGLLRFNPFKDTGGDQSFIVALVDAKETGIVISGLYSRSGTRWYAKKVVNGKGLEHALSEDEIKAVALARQ